MAIAIAAALALFTLGFGMISGRIEKSIRWMKCLSARLIEQNMGKCLRCLRQVSI